MVSSWRRVLGVRTPAGCALRCWRLQRWIPRLASYARDAFPVRSASGSLRHAEFNQQKGAPHEVCVSRSRYGFDDRRSAPDSDMLGYLLTLIWGAVAGDSTSQSGTHWDALLSTPLNDVRPQRPGLAQSITHPPGRHDWRLVKTYNLPHQVQPFPARSSGSSVIGLLLLRAHPPVGARDPQA